MTADPQGPTTVAELVADPKNRRKHNPRNVTMIADALRSVGPARSIVINEANEVLAGNGVVAAAAQAGITRVRTIDVDGDELVAVRRSGLTPEQQRALAMWDNRTAELAEWDIGQLTADVLDAADLTPYFTDDELRAMKVLPALSAPNASNQVVDGAYLVVVTCATEDEQVQLLQRFIAEGLACKALVS